MKALVISGGGSKGAYAGVLLNTFINDSGKQYELFVGSSTGSLLLPISLWAKLTKKKFILL
jgi:predicted patatin/cPLA2 family phospholipase